MTDIEKIIWGVAGAVGVYVVGQLFSKFFIEPVQDSLKLVGEVRFNLAFHGPAIHTPIGRSIETSEAVRNALLKVSCDLIAKLHVVPWYALTRCLAFGALPSRKSVEWAAVALRGLSTHLYEIGDKANQSIDRVNSRVEHIERLLCLKPFE